MGTEVRRAGYRAIDRVPAGQQEGPHDAREEHRPGASLPEGAGVGPQTERGHRHREQDGVELNQPRDDGDGRSASELTPLTATKNTANHGTWIRRAPFVGPT
jgi:hypothetical protein